MFRYRAFLPAAFLAYFAATSVAEISISPETTVVLLNFGSADSILYVRTAYPDDLSVSESSLYTAGEISCSPSLSERSGDRTYSNCSIPLSFDNGVGKDDIVVTDREDSVTGTVIAAGFVIMDDGKIVSGDSGEGVSVGSSGTYTYDVTAVGVDGGEVDISGTAISGSSQNTYNGEIDDANTMITSSTFTLAIDDTGSGEFYVNFDTPQISLDGESFEMNLKVTQDIPSATSPEPAAAVLAKDNTVTIESEQGLDQLEALIRLDSESPETLTLSKAKAINDEFCRIVGASTCGITSVTSGSAIIGNTGNIEAGTAKEKEESLREAIDNCDFQSASNVSPCEELTITGVTVKAVGGAAGATAAGAGIATWTIVLIAGLGAFALIVLIMLGLLAVYRRSAEQSESDYSSSGPLGVPDPSDLLYEQSIVRDIYGRGDFPDGGPSAAVAEQREREANLREEFPRPPSSLGLSRGTTDDASSTYSV